MLFQMTHRSVARAGKPFTMQKGAVKWNDLTESMSHALFHALTDYMEEVCPALVSPLSASLEKETVSRGAEQLGCVISLWHRARVFTLPHHFDPPMCFTCKDQRLSLHQGAQSF